jgi:hypothetical protein
MTGSDVVIDGGESHAVYLGRVRFQSRLLTFLRLIGRIYFVLNGEENSRVGLMCVKGRFPLQNGESVSRMMYTTAILFFEEAVECLMNSVEIFSARETAILTIILS